MAGMPDAVPTVLIDNERVRVTEWRFPPGAHTGWHRHELDYVVNPLTAGRLKLVGPGDAVTYGELDPRKPYYRGRGVEHDVINDSDFEVAFVETEIR